ncbi:MAG: hypothetical protein LBR69_05075 [Endomicrobium sp.]|jgi:F0F1-type ATP synthase assembly protein I|nr:hypothetical protein [Endomicrobium sp.]
MRDELDRQAQDRNKSSPDEDLQEKKENIQNTYDVEGLLGGGLAGLVVGIIISFDAIFAMEIGMFVGLIIGTRFKKNNNN